MLRIKRQHAPKDAVAPWEGRAEIITVPNSAKPGDKVTFKGQVDGSLKLGTTEILDTLYLAEEAGKSKFIVHRVQVGRWYKIMSYDEAARALKLRTAHGTTFPSKVDNTTAKKYVVVVEAGDVAQPSEEALAVVQRLMAAK